MSTQATKSIWENKVREARDALGMSQVALADKLGIGQNTISAIERGVLSGRRYWPEIAEILRVSDPSEIFPYYDYYTFEDAADIMNVSSTLISRRVGDGTLPAVEFGGMHFIPKDALEGVELRNRTGPTMRETLRETLRGDSNGGMTSRELLAVFETDETRREHVRLDAEIAKVTKKRVKINRLLSKMSESDPRRPELAEEVAELDASRKQLQRDRNRLKQTLQTILSRQPEFYVDKKKSPPRWKLDEKKIPES